MLLCASVFTRSDEMVIVDGPHYSRRIANYRNGFAHPRDAYVVKVDRVDRVIGSGGYGPAGANDPGSPSGPSARRSRSDRGRRRTS